MYVKAISCTVQKIIQQKETASHQSLLYRRALIVSRDKAPLGVLDSSQQLMFFALYRNLHCLEPKNVNFLNLF